MKELKPEPVKAPEPKPAPVSNPKPNPNPSLDKQKEVRQKLKNDYGFSPKNKKPVKPVIKHNPTDYNMSADRNADFIEYMDTDYVDQFKEADREKDRQYEEEYDNDLENHIKEHGFEEPLIMGFDPKTGYTMLIEGNHRLMTAKRLGLKEVPVRMLRKTDLGSPESSRRFAGKYLDLDKIPARERIIKERPEWNKFYSYVPYPSDMKPSDWFSEHTRPYQRTEGAKVDYNAPGRWYNRKK